MARAIRVQMTPLPSPFGNGQTIFDGALVSLLPFGSVGSKLQPGQSTPAKLTFSGHFFEKARPDSDGEDETRKLATLAGDLLIDAGLDPTLTFTAKSDLVPVEVISNDDDDDDDDDASEVRVLRFTFDPDQFQGVGDESGTTELLLRIDPARFHYGEVSALLEVNGKAEADDAVNDVLDVLITSRNPGRHLILSLRLTDDAGQPLPNAAVTIVSGAKPADPSADPAALSADADGVIRIKNDPAAELCELTWGPQGASDQPFSRQVFLDLGGDPEQADTRRLSNLGYSAETLEDNVQSFQADFARPITGRLRDIVDDLRALHDDGVEPTPGDDDEPSTDPIALGDGFEADPGDDESDATALA